MSLTPFHLAIQVHDIKQARQFYGATMGLKEGRSSTTWVDFDFYGHQVVLHLNPEMNAKEAAATSPVDGQQVPIPHFGVVLEFAQWNALAARLREKNIAFLIEPTLRFEGTTGEQGTMFFLDPSGNALEFKAFADINAELFAKNN